MVIADKYEIDIKIKMTNWKTMNLIFVLPYKLKKEEPGIVDQFRANCLFELIDDFPLN